MKKFLLLATGLFLVLLQQYFQPISANVQVTLFLTAILLLGVPHGAADTLVATQNAASQKQPFSPIRFAGMYMGRLLLFAAILWFFPLVGNLLFILFAAYHFGETDLQQFNISSILGKLFVISYGLVILTVILVQHFEELQPLSLMFKSGRDHATFINWINQHRNVITVTAVLLFFTCSALYFYQYKTDVFRQIRLLVSLGVLVFILHSLPMVLGFTFYFILWHSLLSLTNIIDYLRNIGHQPVVTIAKQIVLNSVLAIGGIVLFGLVGFMFTSGNSMIAYVFLGLAVLTAPHMQIMHDMYSRIKG